MRSDKEPFIPLRYLVLDGIGALMLGLGLARQLAGVDVLPLSWRFEGYGLTFIVGGILLMLPMLGHVIGKARAQAERKPR
jgi:hypothetical protein